MLVPLELYKIHDILSPFVDGLSHLDLTQLATWFDSSSVQTIAVVNPRLDKQICVIIRCWEASIYHKTQRPSRIRPIFVIFSSAAFHRNRSSKQGLHNFEHSTKLSSFVSSHIQPARKYPDWPAGWSRHDGGARMLSMLHETLHLQLHRYVETIQRLSFVEKRAS